MKNMKKTIITFCFFVLSITLRAQLSVDFGISSQRAQIIDNHGYWMNYFSICPSLKYQHNRFHYRLIYRQALKKSYDFSGYREQVTSSGTDKYLTKINAEFNEKIIGFGMGITFGETDSKTLPYLVLDVCNVFAKVKFENNSSEIFSTDGFEGSNPLNGKLFKYNYSQIRFGAGFQFQLKNNFTLFNEAFLNYHVSNNLMQYSMTVNLGLRYFITKDSSLDKI